MSWLRSCSVSRGLRPAPGRSPSPSSPSALNRLMRSRTVWGWQWSSAAIWLVRAPSQLRVIIRARAIQSPGAWRLVASLRTARSSAGSWGGRADSRLGTGSPGRWQEATKPTTPIIYSQIEERSTSRTLSGWRAGLSSVTEPARRGTLTYRTGAGPTPKQHLHLLEQLPQAQADATCLGRPSRSRVRNPWATDTKLT
jgi:hypothetical protein